MRYQKCKFIHFCKNCAEFFFLFLQIFVMFSVIQSETNTNKEEVVNKKKPNLAINFMRDKNQRTHGVKIYWISSVTRTGTRVPNNDNNNNPQTHVSLFCYFILCLCCCLLYIIARIFHSLSLWTSFSRTIHISKFLKCLRVEEKKKYKNQHVLQINIKWVKR